MLKEKIAISIDKSLLKLLDAQTDGAMIRSRSQAIEYFLRKGLAESSLSDALLLLRGSHQEVALKLHNGKPLIKNQIEFLTNQGISKIYLLIDQPKKELRELLIDDPIEIIDVPAKGTASAIAHLKEKIKTNFLVMSADTYNNFDLKKMVQKHIQLNALATMGLMTAESSSEYGTAILDGDYVIDFKEKTTSLSSHIVNAGIYVFKPEVFELIDKNSLEKDLFPKIAKIKQLVGFFTYGEYKHFG